MESREALEALLDRIDWWGFWCTIAVFVAIGGEAATHLWYKQVNKRLQVVLNAEAAAQTQRLEYTRAKAGPRQLDKVAFSNALHGKPVGTVQILYKPNDVEAFWFAFEIASCLKVAGWAVSDPVPIPIGSGDNLSFGPDAPPEIRWGIGGLTDVTIKMPVIDFGKPDTAEAALRDALMKGRLNPIGGGAMAFVGDPALPADHFIVVVGQKQQG